MSRCGPPDEPLRRERSVAPGAAGRVAGIVAAVLAGLLAGGALCGCEAFQRKLTRKPKRPRERARPIISFQDYSRTMTAVDRYRKHYLLFEYWNADLLTALASPPLNAKRYKRASAEALGELKTLRDIVTEEVGLRLALMIERRERLDRQLQSGIHPSQVHAVARTLERQTREFNREFFWRQVDDHLKPWPPGPEPGAAEAAATGQGQAPAGEAAADDDTEAAPGMPPSVMPGRPADTESEEPVRMGAPAP